MRNFVLSAVLLLSISGCAGLEPALEESSSPPRTQASNLPGFRNYDSLHFAVKTKNYDLSRQVAETAEQIYSKIMFDTNLMSFKPRQNYPITVFTNHEEYQAQTGYPAWSGGGASTQLLGQVLPGEREAKALTSIDTFENVLNAPLLAHEISHLIFNEYMEFFNSQDFERLRWLNEGFATFQEVEAYGPVQKDEILQLTRPLVLQNALPLERLQNFNPFNEPAFNIGSYSHRGRSYLYTNIDVWYWQARELTSFLINSQGRYNFFLLMNALKSRKALGAAIAEAYPGKWRNLADLENEWKRN